MYPSDQRSASLNRGLPVDEVPCQLPSSTPQQQSIVRLERPRVMAGSSVLPRDGVVVVPSREAVAAVAGDMSTSPHGSALVLPFVVDQRPIRPSPGGQYNLTFFDGRAEYERVTSLATAVRPPPPPPPPPLGSFPTNSTPLLQQSDSRRQRHVFLQQLSDDAISDEVFAREFSYERLLALDASIPPRGPRKGLTAPQLSMVLRPRLRRTTSTLSSSPHPPREASSDSEQNQRSSEEGITMGDGVPSNMGNDECAICLEPLLQPPSLIAAVGEASPNGISPRRAPSSVAEVHALLLGGAVEDEVPAVPGERRRGSTTSSSSGNSLLPLSAASSAGASQLRCQHWFHKHCIVNWLLEHTTCPVCRQDVLVMEEESQMRQAYSESNSADTLIHNRSIPSFSQ